MLKILSSIRSLGSCVLFFFWSLLIYTAYAISPQNIKEKGHTPWWTCLPSIFFWDRVSLHCLGTELLGSSDHPASASSVAGCVIPCPSLISPILLYLGFQPKEFNHQINISIPVIILQGLPQVIELCQTVRHPSAVFCEQVGFLQCQLKGHLDMDPLFLCLPAKQFSITFVWVEAPVS